MRCLGLGKVNTENSGFTFALAKTTMSCHSQCYMFMQKQEEKKTERMSGILSFYRWLKTARHNGSKQFKSFAPCH